jgi:hypothetical protein
MPTISRCPARFACCPRESTSTSRILPLAREIPTAAAGKTPALKHIARLFRNRPLKPQDRRTHSVFPIVPRVNRSGLVVTMNGFSLPPGSRVHPRVVTSPGQHMASLGPFRTTSTKIRFCSIRTARICTLSPISAGRKIFDLALLASHHGQVKQLTGPTRRVVEQNHRVVRAIAI